MPSTTAGTIEQVERFVKAVFERGDLVEVRVLPSGEQRWIKAADLPSIVPELENRNRSGQNVYVGANPRNAPGTPGIKKKDCTADRPCGACAKCVALARCLFVDFDGISVDEALRRIDEAGLAWPTVIMESGHGVHFWWRLDEPLADLDGWTGQQKAVIGKISSDATIHDPPRIMRLPGFLNTKEQPFVPCEVVEADPGRVYRVDEFPDPTEAAAPATDNGQTQVNEVLKEGNRNSTLMSLAGAMRRPGMTRAEILPALRAVNRQRCQPPLDDREVDRIAASVAGYEPGAERPHLTEQGNAERLIAGHGRDLLHCDPWGKWLVWDGHRWRVDDTREVHRRAEGTVRSIYGEAAAEQNEKHRKALAAWARKSESKHHAAAMMELAKHRVAVRPDQLDAAPWLLNVLNGTIDLRSGELREHRRKDLITKLAPFDYDPHATCPIFERFLEETTSGREDVATYLQQFLGVALTADVSEQVLPVWWGSGCNGKNTLIDPILAIMGDYAGRAAPDLLVAKKWSTHPTEIADLFGKRLVVASETEKGQRLRVQFVKEITGDATLKGRFMHKDFFGFRRTHKTILVTNNRPDVGEQTHAIWRRLQLVPFTNVVPEDRQDKRLPEKLIAEAPGILAWMVRGCLSWQREGLIVPGEVAAATSQYRADCDYLTEFCEECLTFLPAAWTSSARLAETLDRWFRDNAVEPNHRELKQRLRREGCEPRTTRQGRGWSGVAIVADRVEVPE